MTRIHIYLYLIVAIVVLLLFGGCSTPEKDTQSAPPAGELEYRREDPFTVRPFSATSGRRWIGNAIAYGPYRDGQRPGGPKPSKVEVREDLAILSRHWNLMRLYETGGATPEILEVIREERIDMKVMLGIWIAPEERRGETGTVLERFPEAVGANRGEIEAAIKLAAEYPEIVLCLCVGNETQIFWSAHRSPADQLINYIREVRARTRVPVTTADDFNFWNKPESRTVAREIDCIVMHYHPLWNGRQLEEALGWTGTRYAEVQAMHPEHFIILGETGWATQRHNQGEQAKLMKGKLGEKEQMLYYSAVRTWAEKERIVTFFFVAFDENWKGGDHPDEVEKHWGLYRADRTPKQAIASQEG